MDFKLGRDDVYTTLEPLIVESGYKVVDISSANVKNSFAVHVVIHKAGGVGIKDCETVHRLVYPRLDIMSEDRGVNLEVSSPGLNRNIKYADEFDVFVGASLRVLKQGDSEWLKGVCRGNKDQVLVMEINDTEIEIPISQIQKAKLFYSEEVGKK